MSITRERAGLFFTDWQHTTQLPVNFSYGQLSKSGNWCYGLSAIDQKTAIELVRYSTYRITDFGQLRTFECRWCDNKSMSDTCCQDSVDTSALQVRQRRILASVLVINATTFFMMIVAATISGSSSLLSGALDNLGDALTYALSFAVVGSANIVKAKVALFKGFLIMGAAIAVAIQIGWRLFHMETPIFETMSIAATINLAANAMCLALLHRYRHSDVNMSSVWECSRNDVFEGFAVIAAALLVWAFDSGWPDILIALALLIMFLRSAYRVLLRARRNMRPVVIKT